jgi:hypothetical protein
MKIIKSSYFWHDKVKCKNTSQKEYLNSISEEERKKLEQLSWACAWDIVRGLEKCTIDEMVKWKEGKGEPYSNNEELKLKYAVNDIYCQIVADREKPSGDAYKKCMKDRGSPYVGSTNPSCPE